MTSGVVLQRFVDKLRLQLGGPASLVHPNWQMMPIMKLGNKFNQYLTTSGKKNKENVKDIFNVWLTLLSQHFEI